MLNSKNVAIATLLLAAGLPVAAQAPKISGLGQLWYHQMMDNTLRLNGSVTGPYNLRGQLRENGFTIRRVEFKVAGNATDKVEYEIMIDPSINNNGNSANIVLQDFSVKYKLPANIEVKAGQYKNLQTLEGMTSSSELLFAERSQMARQFGDVRDRGIVGSIGFGDPKSFTGRFHIGMFNGNGKNDLDTNAQKDVVARLEMNWGKVHAFGAYTLQASTNLTDTGSLTGGTFANQPDSLTSKDILDNKDLTNQYGAYYRFQTDSIHASAEFITGLVGRLLPSLNTSGASVNANRLHLDQSFMGYVATFGYTFDNHTFLGRYDYLNYNANDDWYAPSSASSSYNPYIRSNGDDFSPAYTEITLGYIYAFNVKSVKAANVKLNYVMRSKNFLNPRTSAGQTGPQGGDSIVLCFQAAF
ncbi:MAG: OprO/OprP family phosphate-selective porin [Holophagales bacterium]|jgi:hypothetical protein|nr:OprO/OprP family phosphate-selective porin [Holophagales bacterium]